MKTVVGNTDASCRKRLRQWVTILNSLFLAGTFSMGYDRHAAVDYADRYWSPYNELFNNYGGTGQGGDCANFLSQTFIAGNLTFFSSGYADSDGSIPYAQNLVNKISAHHGALQMADYTGTSFPLPNLPVGDPIFRFSILHNQLVIPPEATHSTLIVGMYPDLSFDAHTNDRHHQSYSLFDDGTLIYPVNFLRNFHLPSSPIIKYMLLTQTINNSSRTILEYKYDSDYNPSVTTGEYYANTYNGLTPTSRNIQDNPGIAGTGSLTLKIIFDTTMNTNNISVSCGRVGPSYNDLSFTATEWSNTVQLLDTWQGSMQIGPESVVDGTYTIRVDAFGEITVSVMQDARLNKLTRSGSKVWETISCLDHPASSLKEPRTMCLAEATGGNGFSEPKTITPLLRGSC